MRSTSRMVFCLVCALAVVLAFSSVQHGRKAASGPAPAAAAARLPRRSRFARRPTSRRPIPTPTTISATAATCRAIPETPSPSATTATIWPSAPIRKAAPSKGINGNQNDTSLYAAGAVYVFAKRNGDLGAAGLRQAFQSPAGRQFRNERRLQRRRAPPWPSPPTSNPAPPRASTACRTTSFLRPAPSTSSRAPATAWSQQAYIKASNTGRPANPNDPNDWGDGDQFGFSIALSGDGNVLAVGALSEDSTRQRHQQLRL